MRIPYVLLLILLLAAAAGDGYPRSCSGVCAPTYYIAANSEYKGPQSEMRVRGATNLPPGARLTLDVYDFIGNGSTRFNEDVIAVVDESGFFDVTMRPRPNLQFRHRLICHIVFMPTYPKQSVPVLDAVGRRGEKLGFPQNPQAHVISGGYYLSETIYVP